ncbi:hypothetical protein D9758_005706 [Tetrapyrgos nigripes]|uniref:CCT-theta n=1 Tax=Tetrapyrgos nigripes TaxID=182062 RepID=A0A8H5GK51_9AGAR|nr:hypothetical protein D9758_005706 [Tetrapyrgos nigripes]
MGDGQPTATDTLGFRPKNVSQDMLDTISNMFPDIPVDNIRYDLLRTGSVELTTNKILERGFLDPPPPSYFTLYPRTPASNSTTPANGASASSAVQPKTKETLISRYHLEERLVQSEKIEESEVGGKAAWEDTPEKREASLKERKTKMILAARQRMLAAAKEKEKEKEKEAVQQLFTLPKASNIQLFKEGYKHLQGLDEAVLRNIQAVNELSDLVKTSFGPNGACRRNKLLINHLGRLFVTSDAATIIREVEVVHPAAKLLVMASQAQEAEMGDATNLVIILAGEMLKRSEQLLVMGLVPSEIIKGYEMACAKALEELEKLSTSSLPSLIPPPSSSSSSSTKSSGQATVINALSSALKPPIASKQYSFEESLSSLVAEAALAVMPPNPKNFNVDNVRVVKIMGGSLPQSKVVRGMVFGREPEGQVKKVTRAKVAVFTSALDIAQTETKGTIFKEIADSGVKVIIAGSAVGDLALHYLNRFNIAVLKVLSKFDLRRVCRVVGATPLARVGAPTPEEAGYVDVFESIEIGGDRVTVVRQLVEGEEGYNPGSGGEKSRMATIVLRGATANHLDDLERAIDDGVNVIKSLIKDPRLVPGAGATELELARRVTDYGAGIKGLSQHSVKRFGEALEVVPRQLAENAMGGAKGNEVVSRLWALHESKEKDREGWGVDIEAETDGTLHAPSAAFYPILDSLIAKSWAIKLATEAAVSVLSVDSIIMSKPAGGPKIPQQNQYCERLLYSTTILRVKKLSLCHTTLYLPLAAALTNHVARDFRIPPGASPSPFSSLCWSDLLGSSGNMRESNFAFPVQNKACVCITSQLYDRRALDTTSPLPLFNSLTHLIYLTSTSARIREIMTMDGGLERLVRMLYDFCICPPPPENHGLFYGLAPPSARPAKLVPTLNPTSYDKHAAYRFSLGFQCLVNVGVRGNEAIRSRVVQAGTLEVVGCVLEAWLASKGFAVGPSGQGIGVGYGYGYGRRETREQRHARRHQRQMDDAAELARALQRQMNHTEIPATATITEVDTEEADSNNTTNNASSITTPTSASFEQGFDTNAPSRDRSGTVVAPRAYNTYGSGPRVPPERPAGPSPMNARNLVSRLYTPSLYNQASINDDRPNHAHIHNPVPSHSSSSSSIPISRTSRASPTPSSISASSTDASRPPSPPSTSTSRPDTETEGEDDVDMDVENQPIQSTSNVGSNGGQHQHQRTITHRGSRGTVRGSGRRNSTTTPASVPNQPSIGVDGGIPVGVGGMGGVPVGVNDGMLRGIGGIPMGVGVNDGMGMGGVTMGMGGIPMTMGGMGMEEGILIDVELQNNEDFAMGAPPGAPGAMTNPGGVGALGLQGDLGRFGAPPPAVDGDMSMSEGEGSYSRAQSAEPEDRDGDSEMAVDSMASTSTSSSLDRDMDVRSLDDRESQDPHEERATRSEGEETVSGLGLGASRSGTIRHRRDSHHNHEHSHRTYSTRPDVTPRAGVIGLPPASAGPLSNVPMMSSSRTVMPGDSGVAIGASSSMIMSTDDGQMGLNRGTGTIRERSGTVAPHQQQQNAAASGSSSNARRSNDPLRDLLDPRATFENVPNTSRPAQINLSGSSDSLTQNNRASWTPRERERGREVGLRGRDGQGEPQPARLPTASEADQTTIGPAQAQRLRSAASTGTGSVNTAGPPNGNASPASSTSGTIRGNAPAGTITATVSIASTPSHSQSHGHPASHPTPVSCPYRDEDVLLSLQLLAYLSKYPHVRQAFYKKRERFHPASGTPPASSVSSSTAPGTGASSRAKGKEREREREAAAANFAAAFASSGAGSSSGSRLFRAFSNATARGSGKDRDKQKEKEKDKEKDRVKGTDGEGPSGSAAPPQTNMFALVERFTFRPSSSELAEAANGGTPMLPRLPPEIQYWAAVIMRNACRKDDSRGGIRQCANMLCGKWETFPREFAKCRRCRKAKYCGKECQSTAWSAGHRFWCSVKDVEGEVDDAATATGVRTRNTDAAVNVANANQRIEIPVTGADQDGVDVRIGMRGGGTTD